VREAKDVNHDLLWSKYKENIYSEIDTDLNVFLAYGLPASIDPKMNALRARIWQKQLGIEFDPDNFFAQDIIDSYNNSQLQIAEILEAPENLQGKEFEFFGSFLLKEVERSVGGNFKPDVIQRCVKIIRAYHFTHNIKTAEVFRSFGNQSNIVLSIPFALVMENEALALRCFEQFCNFYVPKEYLGEDYIKDKVLKMLHRVDPDLHIHLSKNKDMHANFIKYVRSFSMSHNRIKDDKLPHWEQAVQFFDYILAGAKCPTSNEINVFGFAAQLVLIRDELMYNSPQSNSLLNQLPALDASAINFLILRWLADT